MLELEPKVSYITDKEYPIRIGFEKPLLATGRVEIPFLCFSMDEVQKLRSFLKMKHPYNNCFDTSCGKYWFHKLEYTLEIAAVNTQDIITLSIEGISLLLDKLNLMTDNLLKERWRNRYLSKIPTYVDPTLVEEIRVWEKEWEEQSEKSGQIDTSDFDEIDRKIKVKYEVKHNDESPAEIPPNETFDQMCKRKRDAIFKDKGH